MTGGTSSSPSRLLTNEKKTTSSSTSHYLFSSCMPLTVCEFVLIALLIFSLLFIPARNQKASDRILQSTLSAMILLFTNTNMDDVLTDSKDIPIFSFTFAYSLLTSILSRVYFLQDLLFVINYMIIDANIFHKAFMLRNMLSFLL
jgi:hypothetical protein